MRSSPGCATAMEVLERAVLDPDRDLRRKFDGL
jgi:hypothetical protein